MTTSSSDDPLEFRPGEFVQLVTTSDDRAILDRIAQVLVDEKLAACVQIIGPLISHYRWEDKRQEAVEWQALAKTTQSLAPQVAARIRELHSYEIPEILCIPVSGGNRSYLAWLTGECQGRPVPKHP